MSLAYEKYNSLCEKSIELFCIGSYAVRLEGGNFFEYSSVFFCCRISPKNRRLNAFSNKQARCSEKGGCEYTFFIYLCNQ